MVVPADAALAKAVRSQLKAVGCAIRLLAAGTPSLADAPVWNVKAVSSSTAAAGTRRYGFRMTCPPDGC
jgi:hypothetical protein